MTRAAPARSAVSRVAAAFWLGAAVAAAAASARAEPATVLLGGGDRVASPPGLDALPGLNAPLERDLPARALRQPAALARERIAAVARVDALLTEASEQVASLREAQALASLAEAERQCEQLGDVPGSAAWCAETQRQLGLVAARAGLDELAAAAFRRAVALEPGRALLAAEAPPQVVERYEAARAELASAPQGVLRVQANVPSARVLLDDSPRGVAPLAVRAPVGRHALRVEAPGHRPWGAFIDVLAGERQPLRVVLSPLPEVEAARALLEAASARRYADVPALLTQLSPLGVTSALLVESADSGRALLVRCDALRCSAPRRIEPGADALQPQLGAEPLDEEALRDARSWLAAPPSRDALDRPTAWWSHWYVWGVAALIVSAGVTSALVLQPEPSRELRVVVQPGAVQ